MSRKDSMRFQRNIETKEELHRWLKPMVKALKENEFVTIDMKSGRVKLTKFRNELGEISLRKELM